MEQGRHAPARIEAGRNVCANLLDHERMLRDRKCVFADGLAIPSRDTREAVRYVFNLNVQGRRIEQVETSP